MCIRDRNIGDKNKLCKTITHKKSCAYVATTKPMPQFWKTKLRKRTRMWAGGIGKESQEEKDVDKKLIDNCNIVS